MTEVTSQQQQHIKKMKLYPYLSAYIKSILGELKTNMEGNI